MPPPASRQCPPTSASPSPTRRAPTAYPISSFTYLLIPVSGTDQAKRKVLKDMLSWIVKSGEGEVSALSYAPLPENVADKELKAIYALQ